jgi:hypothetical protein
METVIEGARMEFLNQMDQHLHYNGSGVRAAIVSVAGSNITLNQAGSIETVFERGHQIVITSTNPSDGTAPVVTDGPFTIVAVNSDLGGSVITVDHAPVSTTGFIAVNGATAGFSSALLNPNIIGLDAYNPFVPVTAGESFLGVDRSVHRSRLSGYRFDGSQRSTEAALKRLATLMAQGGVVGGGAMALMNPVDLDQLGDKLASYQRMSQTAIGMFFFESIALNTPLGRLDCVADPHQQAGFARIVMPGAVQLQFKNGLPHIATLSGGVDQEFGQNFDGRSMRMRAYAQQRCLDPRKLGIVALPAVV